MFKLFQRFLRATRLLRTAYGQYIFQVPALIVISFLSSALEGIGINSLIPMFSFIDKNPIGDPDVITRLTKSAFMYFGLSYSLKSLLIFIAALFFAKAIFLFLANYLTAYISCNYESEARKETLKATINGSWPYLLRQKIGHLEQILITDVNNSSALLIFLGGFITSVMYFIMYTLIVMNVSLMVAVFTFIFGLFVFFIFKPLFYRSKIYAGEVEASYKKLAHYVNESILGLKSIKSMSVGQSVIAKGFGFFDSIKKLNLRVAMLRNGTTVLLQPIGVLFIVGIFAFFYKVLTFNFASFAVMVYAINKMFAYIQAIQYNIHSINSLVPYLTSVVAYRDEALKNNESDKGSQLFKLNDGLEFDTVGFAYQTEKKILENVSFCLKKGEVVGLIGPSGAGKTTMVDLVLRLFNPTSGSIRLDGKNIGDINLESWRRNVGYVSQDIFLLNDTIENNIKFYDSTISDGAVAVAAESAYVNEFVDKLPSGYKTIVGERGVRLSGGQRQRIILARILARNPQILILDEATSALDNESESFVQKSIGALRGRVTALVIAHRLTTVRDLDRLLVLDNGKIVEEGRPDALLADPNSYFHKVYNLRDEAQLN